MKTFHVHTLNGPPCDISDLEIVGSFSVDGQQGYRNDLSQLKYYKGVPNNAEVLDLNEGMDGAVLPPDEYDIKLDHLLKWLSENLNLLDIHHSEVTHRSAQIVCTRGIMKQLFLTPFEKTESWIICASKLKDTIYLCFFETDEIKEICLSMREVYKRRSAWGFRFEQYLMSGSINDPSKGPDLNVPLNCNAKFYAIFKSRFGETNLLYSAKMDGVSCQQTIEDTIVGKKLEFIELKTVPRLSIKHGKVKSPYHAVKHWCQSYLAGIKTIVCGHRYDGIVDRIDILRVNQFDYAKTLQNECKTFCSQFLEIIKDTVRESYKECLYKFEYKQSNGTITVERINPKTEDENEKQYIFLPDWYIERVEEQFADAL